MTTCEALKSGTRVRYTGEFSAPADYFPTGRKCVTGPRYPAGTEARIDGAPLDLYSKVLLRVRWADGYMTHVDARDVEVLDD